ncbi:branched-chain amino acid transaminase [Billgrantia desiderata]|uniref:Branched-chain-amino-acid aminotransferase n=1 Tax=Billgrantia desiderata TaxID=52021 RepID=A0ABS9B196_9GAMM|nr:branched-chain amino acid transaminase [Halomonas desiderata]MCE8010956.1 branched-chain amino acid transaminase [Halomonas desiderata]MCE8027626.1 branched-chain amino acid transaminase [Halomonas desiderata]MCE8041241.1 branched-chain amino acid transaminase [Halomonas desiderata]MCE8045816.1 branched-chain amino acid transaminase [Halomonas desiderata]NIC35446.1 branched-chain amino acid transaminase [Halomonas desiderata]
MTPLYDRDGWIWLDGEWLPWRDAKTHLLTHTLHYGMGCFEGVRAYAGAHGTHLFRVAEHTRRLLDSAHALDIPVAFDEEVLIEAQRQCLVRNELRNAYLKPTVFFGAEGLGLRAKGLSVHVMIAAWDLGDYVSSEAATLGLRALTSSWARHHVNISLCRAKTNGHYVNSILALNTAVKAGFDEAIMLDPEGYVAEASAANVFLLRDGALHTPEVTSCLQGITRDSVIHLAREVLGLEVRERRITRDELYTADEAFVTGTAAEILPLRELDGRHIGARAGAPLPGQPIDVNSVTAQLQQLYRQVTRGELEDGLANYGVWLTSM